MKKFLNWIAAVLIVFGSYKFYEMYNIKKIEKEIKGTKIGEYLKTIYGSTITIEDVVLVKDKNKEKTYTGIVTFKRNGKSCTRPIKVTYDSQFRGKEIEYHYGLDFRCFLENKDILLEDVDVFYKALKFKSRSGLYHFDLIETKYISPGVVRCTLKCNNTSPIHFPNNHKQGSTFIADLHITVANDGDSITYELQDVLE